MSDEIAVDAIREAEEIGQILLGEVRRIAAHRRSEWSMSLKVMAANMMEAHAERAAIWEGCKSAFLHHGANGHSDSDVNLAYNTIPSPLQQQDVSPQEGSTAHHNHNITHNH